jgi:hypothetical protein
MISLVSTRPDVHFQLCVWNGDPDELMDFIPNQFDRTEGEDAIVTTLGGEHQIRISAGHYVLKCVTYPDMPALFFFPPEISADSGFRWLETLFQPVQLVNPE